MYICDTSGKSKAVDSMIDINGTAAKESHRAILRPVPAAKQYEVSYKVLTKYLWDQVIKTELFLSA